MITEADPPRLRDLEDGLPGELRDALGRTSDGEPSALEASRLRADVFAAVGIAPVAPVPPASPAGGDVATGAAGAAAAASKSLLAVAVPWFGAPIGAALVVAAALYYARPPQSAAEPDGHATAAAAPIAAPVRASESPPHIEEAVVREADAPARSEGTAPAGRSTRRLETQPVPAAAPEVPAPPAAAESEGALLARAQQALRGSPGEALSLAAEHERRFTSGALVEEREVIAIGALVQLGRRAEGEARAARFRARFPASAYERRLDVLLR